MSVAASYLTVAAVLILALPLAFAVMGCITWLSDRPWVREINARVAAEYDANPLGGAKVWNGEVRR